MRDILRCYKVEIISLELKQTVYIPSQWQSVTSTEGPGFEH